jgi:hypothetical protein
MKISTFFKLLFIVIFTISIHAQIPNNSFEDWANGDPVGWSTLDILGDAVSQSSESHSGSSAAKLQIIDFNGSAIPLLLTTNNIIVTENYGSLTGYYKFAPADANEIVSVAVLMSHGSSIVGGGSIDIKQAVSSYTQFAVPIDYIPGTLTADTAYIQFTVADTSEYNGGIGTYALIDDLSFGGAVGVEDRNNITSLNNFELEQNYPNPFNPSTNISYKIHEAGNVSLKVYNVLGTEVATLVDEYKPAGSYTIKFNASNISSGIYFYKLTTGNYSEIKKMTLLK